MTLADITSRARGVILAGVIAAGAAFVSEHYGAPVMLFALLIGMAFHFLALEPATQPGIDFAAATLLRLGVGMLGVRLGFADIASLGWAPVLAVIGLVAATLAVGAGLARVSRRSLAFGLLTGGAVAICGASAALAIAAVLPRDAVRDRDVLFSVIGVTALSTLAMIAYPVLFAALQMGPLQSGFLIGATIHDVAQVVGAGYSMDEATGDIATYVKLQRVALLPVVLVAVMWVFRGQAGAGAVRLPWFLVLFVGLVLAGNLGLVPEVVRGWMDAGSRALLVTAIAALGVKTSLSDLGRVGRGHAVVLVGATLFILVAALAAEIALFA